MATLYLKVAGGNFNGANWSTTGAAGVDSVTPTAADNCIAELASGNLTINTGSVCRSFDETSGTGAYTGTVTQNASATWTIGDATSGAGNVGLKFNAAATFNRGASAVITFVSTNGTAQTITCAGENLSATTFNGIGGSWTFSDAFSATTTTVTLTAGTLTTGAFTHNWGQFSTAAGQTRALNITGSTINGLSIVQPWTMIASGMTFTATGSTLNVANAAGTFTSGGLAYGTVNFTSITGLVALAGGGTYVNLSATSTGKLGQFRLANDITWTGTLTWAGGTIQGVDRLVVFSITPGTTRTLTGTGGAVVIAGDVDFIDIVHAGSPSWTNASSAFVGDGGGNGALITANANVAATQTATGTASFTWSTHAWTTRVPLPQDNVVINNAFVAGRTITADMPRLGKDIDCSSATGSPIFLTTTATSSYGSLAFSLGMTCTGTNAWTLAGRSTISITTAGVSIANPITISNVGGTTNHNDAFTTTAAFVVSDGTWNTNNSAMTVLTFAAATRTTTLNYGTTIMTLTGTTGTLYTDNAATTTTNGSSATLVVSVASASSRTILSRSAAGFAALTYTVAGSSGTLVLTTPGATTYTTMNIGSGRTINLQSTRTFTVTTFNVNGTAGNLVTIISSAGGSAAILTFTGGYASSDYLSVQDITASPYALYAGTHSTDAGGNTNVIFTAPPSGTPNLMMMGLG